MLDLALTSDTHDIYLDDRGDLAMVAGADCAAQLLGVGLRLFRGEWYLDIDAGIPLVHARTLESVVSDAMAPTAFTLALVGIAALAALLLGIVGVYGVVAYAVSQRTNEIGVRMALGARADHVRWMVLRQGGAVVGTGVALGLAAALGLTRLMGALLFEVSPSDPATYAALTLILVTASALALWFPARRASRVSPMEALRRE